VNDLAALRVEHPAAALRDSARYPPLMTAHASGGRGRPRKLAALAKEHLGLTIQEREHDPAEDARAALALYSKFRGEWERWAASGGKHRGGGAGAPAARVKSPAQALAELAKNDYMSDL
jgi:hypothetical protein